jgi:hypothetical protein
MTQKTQGTVTLKPEAQVEKHVYEFTSDQCAIVTQILEQHQEQHNEQEFKEIYLAIEAALVILADGITE